MYRSTLVQMFLKYDSLQLVFVLQQNLPEAFPCHSIQTASSLCVCIIDLVILLLLAFRSKSPLYLANPNNVAMNICITCFCICVSISIGHIPRCEISG